MTSRTGHPRKHAHPPASRGGRRSRTLTSAFAVAALGIGAVGFAVPAQAAGPAGPEVTDYTGGGTVTLSLLIGQVDDGKKKTLSGQLTNTTDYAQCFVFADDKSDKKGGVFLSLTPENNGNANKLTVEGVSGLKLPASFTGERFELPGKGVSGADGAISDSADNWKCTNGTEVAAGDTLDYSFLLTAPKGVKDAGTTLHAHLRATAMPTLVPDVATIEAGGTAVVNVLENDILPPGTTLTGVQGTADTSSGVWEVVGETIQFTPDAGFTGSAAAEYTVTAPDGTRAASNGGRTASASITVEVTPVPATAHTVTFHANDGTEVQSQQTATELTALAANTFVRENHTFARWNTAADGSGDGYEDGAPFAFDADLDLYAQWIADDESEVVPPTDEEEATEEEATEEKPTEEAETPGTVPGDIPTPSPAPSVSATAVPVSVISTTGSSQLTATGGPIGPMALVLGGLAAAIGVGALTLIGHRTRQSR